MAWYRCLAGFLFTGALFAQASFFPLKDIRPGMKGVGRSVFSGSRIEEFQVEILGVLENVGPRQSIILGRLSGGPLQETGVMQGMSGSPVYIDGRLAGAVAMAFAFSKEPVAGIRPIEEMLRVRQGPARIPARAKVALSDQSLEHLFPAPEHVMAGGGRMVDIATPLSFSGFTRSAIERFAPQLRALGMEPRQGMAGGGRISSGFGNPSAVQPGAMISVQLVSGDMSVGADGTVTYVDGKNLYAFGHRFLSVGNTDLPFARSEVLTLLPNLSTSFKISAPREWMGSITQDRSTAVAGELGRQASLIPVAISLLRHTGGKVAKAEAYNMQMVKDPILSPFLLQLQVFSAIDATEQTVGDSTYAVSGEVEFENGSAPLKLNNMFAGDFNVPVQVSLAAAVPLAYVMQSGFDSLHPKKIALSIDAFEHKRQLQIDQVWTSRREVQPGESVELTVVLTGDNGLELTKKVTYTVPVGAPAGPLLFTVSDGNTVNFAEYRQMIGVPAKSAAQLISFINSLRANTKAYVRISRPEPSFDVQGETLPDPPPSLALILARNQASLGSAALAGSSKVAEMEINAGDMVVSGSKTIQVEVKQ